LDRRGFGVFYSIGDIGYRSFGALPRKFRRAASTAHVMKFFAALVLLFNAMFAAGADVQPSLLRVVTFNGGWDLPIWAAQRQGFFEGNGVTVQLSYTPSSEVLITGLFDGRFDIALATIDNFIAYQEGQGEAKLPAEPDLFSFIGGDGGFLSIVASPGVKSFADLKGKTLSVDAMTNGLAFVLRELLARNGLAESDVKFVRAGGTPNRYRDLIAGKHDATLLRTPFELLAKNRGFNQLATAESLGAYEGTVGATRRSWAADHQAALIGFMRGYRAGVEWVYDRTNRDVAEALLVANIRDMTPALAKQSYELLLADKGGLARDAALDIEGIRTVLRLRSKFGTPQRELGSPEKYIDLGYYEKAFGKR
jgi:ABC-type nitrate/sulfonate/bicarbonate transport system substrate-binding protein